MKNIPLEISESDFFEHVITLNGRLPLYNHEIICTHMPVEQSQLSISDSGDRSEWAYLRWSSANYADECIRLINSELQFNLSREIRMHAFRPGHPFRVKNEFNRVPRIGQQRMYSHVWGNYTDIHV